MLIDTFGRTIEYLRLSVTDRCDLRCVYCLPKDHKEFQEPDHWLTFDEIQRLIRLFSELGVSKIRITGGEPLVRRNLSQLIQQLSQLPKLQDLSLSTNALQLEKHAQALYQSGVSRLNISLDSLNPQRFKQITNGPLAQVLAGIMAAKQAGFSPIKINMVLMKGVNEDEVEAMVNFCIEHGFTLRFIETMPMGSTGQQAMQQYINLDTIRQQLEQRFNLIPTTMLGNGPARYLQVAHTKINIGFITPISQHFCETCNRVRLSVDGVLYLCLGQEHSLDLRLLLRQGLSDQELSQAILTAIADKPERHEFHEKPEQTIRFMSKTGG